MKYKKLVELTSHLLSDKTLIRLKYKYHMGESLNYKKPQTFTEKLQWLKLYDHRPEYSMYVDKYSVRSYISKKIGDEYLIPIVGVYENVEEINWSTLPNKFVIKCTHGSSCNIICVDKNKLSEDLSKEKLDKWMKRNWFWYGREWPYKNVKPRILCEEYMVEENGKSSLTDYKFYCFDGVPTYCQVIRDRNSEQTIDFYDKEWNYMEFTGLQKSAKLSGKIVEKPQKYDEMLELATILSKELPFVRVDLYFVNNKIYFGELTLYPLSGFGKFDPPEWNTTVGNLLKLPVKN